MQILKKNYKYIIIGLLILAIAASANQIYLIQKQSNDSKSKREEFTALKTSNDDTYSKELATTGVVEGGDHEITREEYENITDSEFKKPECERLENRKAINIISNNCEYSIKATGPTNMAVVFVYENDPSLHLYNQYVSGDENNYNSLAYGEKYIREQSKKYGIENFKIDFEFFGPYKITESVSNYYYREESIKIMEIFSDTSKRELVPEENFDMVHYIKLDDTYGGIAMPWAHRAFTYDLNVPVFVHETLHLFGAEDKYNNDDCITIGGSDPFGRYSLDEPGSDIMCSAFSLVYSTVNDITAREIGWEN